MKTLNRLGYVCLMLLLCLQSVSPALAMSATLAALPKQMYRACVDTHSCPINHSDPDGQDPLSDSGGIWGSIAQVPQDPNSDEFVTGAVHGGLNVGATKDRFLHDVQGASEDYVKWELAGKFFGFIGRVWSSARWLTLAPREAELLQAGLASHKGQAVTVAGRAITKHPEYFGFANTDALRQVYRTDQSLNDLATKTLESVLGGVRTTGEASDKYPKGWQTYTTSSGLSASWDSLGNWIGWRGPRS
jgi:hypothetical protein